MFTGDDDDTAAAAALLGKAWYSELEEIVGDVLASLARAIRQGDP